MTSQGANVPSLSHDDLCERARRWLSGTRRCDPVFSNIASCAEIPDAIGWSSAGKWYGSTVVECKTSLSDFHADKSVGAGRGYGVKSLEKEGYVPIPLSCMGDYRFFMCAAGVISTELVERIRPDHGLLWVEGRKVQIMREAPRRELVDKDGEIRYLRFAIINGKEPYKPCESDRAQLAFGEYQEIRLGNKSDGCGRAVSEE